MDAKDQIREVNAVLDKLTRFRHLNGWAAVAAGVIAILGFFSINVLFRFKPLDMEYYFEKVHVGIGWNLVIFFGVLLLVTGIICGAIVLFSLPKNLTAPAFKNLIRLVGTLSLYIIGGGLVAFRILEPDSTNFTNIMLMPTLMSILYGLALMHVSYFSENILKYVGIYIFICGCIAAFIPNYSWLLWVIAFGGGHIVAGILMIRKKNLG